MADENRGFFHHKTEEEEPDDATYGGSSGDSYSKTESSDNAYVTDTTNQGDGSNAYSSNIDSFATTGTGYGSNTYDPADDDTYAPDTTETGHGSKRDDSVETEKPTDDYGGEGKYQKKGDDAETEIPTQDYEGDAKYEDKEAGEEQKGVLLTRLEEFRLEAYENAKIFKERTKKFHDKKILDRTFKEGDLVLLYNSRLRLFPGKLKSRWCGPFRVSKVFPSGAVELLNLKDQSKFVVNAHRVKHYIGLEQGKEEEVFYLADPTYQ